VKASYKNSPYVWLVGCSLGAIFLVVTEVAHGFNALDIAAWGILGFALVTRVVIPLRKS
jgi:hypothetical protein